jgi:ABC-type phosphate transport system substrate-binding protein
MKKFIYAILLVASASIFADRAQSQVIVIANPGVKATEISKNDLRDVFTGAATTVSGSNVTPILLKAGGVNDEFLAAYIGKNDTAFRASWRSLVFSGQASMPKSLESDVSVVDFVAHNAGAIGYISKATPHAGVKVLIVR